MVSKRRRREKRRRGRRRKRRRKMGTRRRGRRRRGRGRRRLSRRWACKKKREGGEEKRGAEGDEEGSHVSHDKVNLQVIKDVIT